MQFDGSRFGKTFVSRYPWRAIRPASFSDDEARLAGMLQPKGWVVPNAPIFDRIATPFRILTALFQFVRIYPGLMRADISVRNKSLEELLTTLGIELHVKGMENIPPHGGLFMWNQTSHLDHLILAAALPVPVRSLYNIEVSRLPFYGKLLRDSGHYLVNRFDERQWRAALLEAAAWTALGNYMLVSPEGTRSWDGGLLPMKRGAFILAIDSRRPIVPVVLHGAHAAMPRGRLSIQAGKVNVRFLAPIPTQGIDQSERERLQETFTFALQKEQQCAS